LEIYASVFLKLATNPSHHIRCYHLLEMSWPITIRRARASSSSSSSASSSMVSSLSSAPTTPTSTHLYVPVHKRAGSTSSRASSPASSRTPASIAPKQHPLIYTAGFLLSLRPQADESMKEKMRTACPEVVMNRRTRKNLEFAEHQQRKEAASKKQHASRHQHQEQSAAPATSPTPAPVAAPAPAKVAASIRSAAPAVTSRILPRRNRPAGRAPERRRQALQTGLNLNDNWRDSRLPLPAPLPVV